MSAIHRLAVIGAVVLSFLFLSPVYAASACKGLSKSSCGSNSSCTWVDGYTRKDGKKVSAYCRAVGKKKSDSKKATKASSSKTTTDTKKKTTKDTKKTDKKKTDKKKSDKKKTTKKKSDKKETKKSS